MSIKVEYDKRFMERLGENLERETTAMLDEATSLIQANVRAGLTSSGIVNTGNLRDSYQRSVTVGGGRGIGIVGSNAIHALPMELGIQKRFFPSQQMIEGLRLWARRKLGLNFKEAQRAGAAIAWKIARKGLDPKRFPSFVVRDAFLKSEARIPLLIERHIRRAMALSARFS